MPFSRKKWSHFIKKLGFVRLGEKLIYARQRERERKRGMERESEREREGERKRERGREKVKREGVTNELLKKSQKNVSPLSLECIQQNKTFSFSVSFSILVFHYLWALSHNRRRFILSEIALQKCHRPKSVHIC